MTIFSAQRAFTLVELLSVIVILSMIAVVIALPLKVFTSKLVSRSDYADFSNRFFLVAEYIRKQLELADFQSISVSASGDCLYFIALSNTREKPERSICLISEELRLYKKHLIEPGYTLLEKKVRAKQRAFQLEPLASGNIKKISLGLFLFSSDTQLEYNDEIFIKSFQN